MEKVPANPAPCLKSDATRDEPGSGSLVITVILAIVLAVVIVATFYEDEYNSLLAMLGLSEADTTAEIIASAQPGANMRAADTASSTNEHEQAAVLVTGTATDRQIAESTTVVADTDSNAANARDNAATVSPAPSPDAPASPMTPYADSPYYRPYYASPDYGTAYQAYAYNDSQAQREMIAEQRRFQQEIEEQRRKDREEMMEYRRQAWLEAERARREQRANMLSVRTAVLKRIEQDRADMDRRFRQMNEAMDKRRDRADMRMMEYRRLENRTEI
jgi:hypothetical protein